MTISKKFCNLKNLKEALENEKRLVQNNKEWSEKLNQQDAQLQQMENLVRNKFGEQLKVIAQDNYLLRQKIEDKENMQNRRKSLGMTFRSMFRRDEKKKDEQRRKTLTALAFQENKPPSFTEATNINNLSDQSFRNSSGHDREDSFEKLVAKSRNIDFKNISFKESGPL